MKADPELMRQVIANLIDNAAEAMEVSTLRRLGVATRVDSDGDAVEIEISDSGLGISPADKEQAFFAALFNQGSRHGVGTCDCEPDRRGTQRNDSHGRQFAGGHALSGAIPGGRASGSTGDGAAGHR